jgi:hypothetical protein
MVMYSWVSLLRNPMISGPFVIEEKSSQFRWESCFSASPMIVNSRSTAERIRRLLQ